MSLLTVEVSEAGAQLADLIAAAQAGDEVVLTREHLPVARLAPVVTPARRRLRRLGSAAGLVIIADDFDEPLEDFEPYMR